MQNSGEDTEWNSVLRQKGVLPPKKEVEITEDQIVNMVDNSVHEKMNRNAKDDMTLDELDELEDDEDEKVLLEYRNKRIAEMKLVSEKSKFGDVRDISADDYVEQVNRAGEGIFVILHLYKSGIPLCTLINQYLVQLAAKFPATKFLRSISTTCIPNFPDKNLPTIFVYSEGKLRKQLIGADAFNGINLKIDELEWLLSESGAFKTTLESDPRPKIRDVLFSSLRMRDDDSDNDW